jgi:hypothetical protein
MGFLSADELLQGAPNGIVASLRHYPFICANERQPEPLQIGLPSPTAYPAVREYWWGAQDVVTRRMPVNKFATGCDEEARTAAGLFEYP